MTKSNKGFSAVGIIGLLPIFAIVAAVGYYVYKSQNDDVAYDSNDTNTQVAEVTKEEDSSTPPDQIQYDKFVVVGQKDGSTTLVSPDKIAKNQDQIDILLALRDYCRDSNADFVGVYYKVFEDNVLYVNKNDRAIISAANCTSESGDGGGARYLLYKNSQGNWYYHFGSQEPPTCDRVDGWGYPDEVVPDCYDKPPSGETRAPR